jgi:alpha-beta hydrolase superfamily lysophospholipase
MTNEAARGAFCAVTLAPWAVTRSGRGSPGSARRGQPDRATAPSVLDHRSVAVVGRVAATLGVGIGTGAVGLGAVGIGWFYSNVLLDPRQQPVFPERVLAADPSTVTLAATRLAAQPGIWGLRWAGGLTRLGPVVVRDRESVVRPLLGGPTPPVGTRATIDLGPYDPDPQARGLAFSDVHVQTPLGPAPAWFVPPREGPRRDGTWVVMVHGRGGTRREGLRVLPALHRRGHPVLLITYRNDAEAPPSPDGRYHLGDTEWEDVEAAVRHARACGARRVVLYAWSMGAAISGAFLDRSPEAAVVGAMVWDAPLVDWRATLRQQARNRRLPTWLIPATTAITSRRIGIDFDRFDLRARPPAVRPPTLVVHSSADTAVPVAPSRALAAAAPALDWPMRYLEVPDVEHTGSWNADPAGYERAVVEFLADHLD